MAEKNNELNICRLLAKCTPIIVMPDKLNRIVLRKYTSPSNIFQMPKENTKRNKTNRKQSFKTQPILHVFLNIQLKMMEAVKKISLVIKDWV